jgi:cytochrome c-type biogenesis protein CcmH
MLDIWLGSFALLLLATLFLLWPLLRRRQGDLIEKAGLISQQSLNIAVFKDRLLELEREKSNGLINEQQLAQLRAELESGLLSDAEGTGQARAESMPEQQTLPWLMVLILVAVLPFASWSLYSVWGAYDSVADARTNKTVAAAEEMPTADIELLLETLKQRLQESPENLDGWFLLGRSYMNMGRYEEAIPAFYKVTSLLEQQGEDASAVYGMIAQALFFAREGMTDEVQLVVNKALAQNPDEINSLGLMGMQAYDEQRFVDAAKAWQRILDVAPDHPSRQAIEEGVNKARAHLSGSELAALTANAAAIETSTQPADSGFAGLTINVDIAPDLKATAAPEDTVFIYARAANGPRMPLAIIRKQVRDLPVKVVLDDGMAMSPTARLSSVPEVEILARVSKAGTPEPNSGDLEGSLGPIVLREQTSELYVLIEKILK